MDVRRAPGADGSRGAGASPAGRRARAARGAPHAGRRRVRRRVLRDAQAGRRRRPAQHARDRPGRGRHPERLPRQGHRRGPWFELPRSVPQGSERAVDFESLAGGDVRRAGRARARGAGRDGLLALHLRDDRHAQGGRALSPHAAGRPPLRHRRAGHRPRRPGLRDLQALLRLRPRQCARPAALRARERLPPPGLGGGVRGARGAARLPADALLLGADRLRAAPPGRPARGRVSLGASLRLGGRAASRGGLPRLEGALRRGDPRRHRRHGDDLHVRLEPRRAAAGAGTTGTPVDGTEIKLLDAAGQPVADGAQGVLWAKTPSTAASATGSASITRAAPSSATGSARATSTSATPTAFSPTAGARTTSSRWRDSGSCRATSRRR